MKSMMTHSPSNNYPFFKEERKRKEKLNILDSLFQNCGKELRLSGRRFQIQLKDLGSRTCTSVEAR